MSSRRTFLKSLAGAAIAQAVPAAKRREVRINGKRIKTVDVHAHCFFPEVLDLLKDNPLAQTARGTLATRTLVLDDQRLRDMDAQGIDVQVINVNAWAYNAERGLAQELVALQNEKIAQWVAEHPDRFVGMATVALQYPELAAEQL